MSRLFGRVASVLVARDTPLRPLQVGSPLRIQFKVEKQPLTPPNTAEISITNLSAESRRALQKFGALVELRAGYVDDGAHLPLLFRGDARTIDSVKRGAEWITKIQCGDGEIAYRFASVNLSFGLGTSAEVIARALAMKLQEAGVDVSAFLSQLGQHAIAFPVPQFVFGFATQGNALQELDKLIAPRGYLVSIQAGKLRVIPANGTSPKEAILIAEGSGLVASPEHGSPDRNGLPSVLKVRSLLLGALEPGDPFILKSADLNGSFRAEKVSHVGDTHGGEWTTEIEARAPVR
jgi:hypothetical protein